MKTFHEQPEASDQIEYKNEEGQQVVQTITPFRLSFHGNSHYNCIVPITWNTSQAILGEAKPGEIESEAIKYAIEDHK